MKNTYALLALSIFLLLGCSKDNPVNPEPEPVDTQIATYVRLDFVPIDGGMPAYIDIAYDKKAGTYSSSGSSLRPDKTYSVNLTLEDRRQNPVKNIKNEIAAHPNDYQVFYTVSDATKLSFSYNDIDGKGFPIGISTKATTSAGSSNPTLKILIKYAPGKKDGNINTGTTVFETIKVMSIL
ncbi:MAG: hypothetical protein ABI266_00940 [Ginsengibacter sp.]